MIGPDGAALVDRSAERWHRRQVQRLARWLIGHDQLWRWIQPWADEVAYLRVQRSAATEARFQRKVASLLASGVVRGGPFAGMKFPPDLAYWGATYAKLLGSYESELHSTFERLFRLDYDTIVDIGFAEGFYLGGLGRRFPQARLRGFDIDARAHAACARLSELNGIDPQRLHLAHMATVEHIQPALRGRALVICDCEGYERELFMGERPSIWQNADLVIECHDFVKPGVTAELVSRLSATHSLTLVPSVEPVAKASGIIDPAVLADFSLEERTRLVDEGRPAPQTWIVGIAHQRAREPVLS